MTEEELAAVKGRTWEEYNVHLSAYDVETDIPAASIIDHAPRRNLIFTILTLVGWYLQRCPTPS